MLITSTDYVMFPLYFLILLAIVMRRSKKLETPLLKKYYLRMFLIHAAGCFLHSMVIEYYYGYSDAISYFQGGEFIKQSVLHSGYFLKTFLLSGADLQQLPGAENLTVYALTSLDTPSSLAAMKFSGFFSLFSFSHFLVNALFCGLISFIGVWKLFRVFDEISMHKYQNHLAMLLIYTPTIWFWGSGMGKDSLSIGIMGILISCLYQLSAKRKILPNLFGVLITTIILLQLKTALIGLIGAGACGYAAVNIINRTKNVLSRTMVIILFIAGFTGFFMRSLDNISDSLEEIQTMVESNIVSYAAETEGSDGSFAPPQFTFTPAGIAAAIPITVFSTLFRPFVWETRKPIMAFSALESFLMLFSLLYVVFKRGPVNFVRGVFTQPAVMFSVIFCMLLAMIVGFTTFNLGTLVRYRLPLLPFYLFIILAVNQYAKEKRALKKFTDKNSLLQKG